IIEKPGKLSEVEWEIMKQHSKNGVEIVMETGITSAIALMIISQHHENHASSGYPTGINSLRLSIYSNMAAIVDVYDAITSKRPYANRESGFNAVRLLLLKKKLYNAKILAKFIDMLGVDRGMNASAENLSGQSVF
ncbi:MAG: hypothetical protein KAI81_03290, partial [Candidatus Marinimicrobia bacterium]|nr:hypothetical protein [Candidatus Neomarinimicrobiota bacterium]